MPSDIDVITLPDLKGYKARGGTDRDIALGLFITGSSRTLEGELDRRIRYRGPAEVVGSANIRVATTLAAGDFAPTAQPAAAGRTLKLTVTPTDPKNPPKGIVTLKGTVGGVVDTLVALDLADGLVQHTREFFTALHASQAISVGTLTGAGGTFKVGSSEGYTEFHTVSCDDPCHILTIEWPLHTLLEVNEDPSLVHGASTKLVAGTDYRVIYADRERMGRTSIVRLSGGFPTPWAGGERAVKLIGQSAGYGVASVPQDIKDVSRRLVEILEDEVSNGRIGISAMSDPSGNFTRWSAAGVTPEMRRQLAQYRRRTFGVETGTREFPKEDVA